MADTQYVAGITEEQAKAVSEIAAEELYNTDGLGDLTDEELEAIILSSLRLDIA